MEHLSVIQWKPFHCALALYMEQTKSMDHLMVLWNGSLQACQNLCKLLQIVNFVHVDLINKFSWTSASGLINNNKSSKPIFRELIMCKKQHLSMIYDLTYSTEQKTVRYNTSFMNEQVHIIQWMYVRQWTCETVKGVSKWKCKFVTRIIF